MIVNGLWGETEIASKVCRICGEEKPLDEYHKHSHNIDGYDSRCKPCFKKDSLYRQQLRKFPPIPKTDLCECCGTTGLPHGKSMVVDHDHTTLLFRGWICDFCNLGIGKLGDTPTGIIKALKYFLNSYQTPYDKEVLDGLEEHIFPILRERGYID